jgi:hypothetical protein
MILENFNVYSECKDTLIESYGDIEIAKRKILSQHPDLEEHIIEENLTVIKEGLGDKIINFFSKVVGGDIKKLNKILQDMKDEEIRFIKDEHDGESKFYKLSSALAQLRKDKSDKSEQDLILVKLNKVQKLIKDLVSSHNSIMDDLEKQVGIIIKDNKRKTEYYNLKRAEDSVETKKLRVDFKKKLVSDEDSSEYLSDIQKILGNPKDAEKDLEKAKDTLSKEKESIGASDEITKMPSKKIESILDTYHKQIMASIKDIKDHSDESIGVLKDLRDKDAADNSAYSGMKDMFNTKKDKTVGLVETAISKIAQVKTEESDNVEVKNKAIDHLIDIKNKISKINYLKWPSQDLDKEKEKIDRMIKKISEEFQKAA